MNATQNSALTLMSVDARNVLKRKMEKLLLNYIRRNFKMLEITTLTCHKGASRDYEGSTMSARDPRKSSELIWGRMACNQPWSVKSLFERGLIPRRSPEHREFGGPGLQNVFGANVNSSGKFHPQTIVNSRGRINNKKAGHTDQTLSFSYSCLLVKISHFEASRKIVFFPEKEKSAFAACIRTTCMLRPHWPLSSD